MVVTTAGINRMRALLDADVFKCQAGIGTTAPTVDDTSLESADSNTLLAVTTTATDKALQITHSIASTIGSGTAYSEQETQINSGNTMLNRIVHTALTKGANDEYTYITNWFLESV